MWPSQPLLVLTVNIKGGPHGTGDTLVVVLRAVQLPIAVRS